MKKICIIGAGPCGLTALKNLVSAGFECDLYEKEAELGGVWNYAQSSGRVYQSTHLISSKERTQYFDFNFPDDFPPYPKHTQVLSYLKMYAEHFSLNKHIYYQTEVISATGSDNGWKICLKDKSEKMYDALVVANGHLWDPAYPKIEGDFNGLITHSADYKTPADFHGKNVLVVGAGNSGCDIAAEVSQFAKNTFHSMRRGYYFIPKFFFGKPADQVGLGVRKLGLPLVLRRALAKLLIKISNGFGQDYGLQKPDHDLFDTHPIVNSQILYAYGHGDIVPKPNIKMLSGSEVCFEDNTRENIDVIVYSTGYKISFPFLDTNALNLEADKPKLYLNIFPPHINNLFFVGLVQADGGLFGLADKQSQLISSYLQAKQTHPAIGKAFDKKKLTKSVNLDGGYRYVKSNRHTLEVDCYNYTREIERQIRRLNKRVKAQKRTLTDILATQ